MMRYLLLFILAASPALAAELPARSLFSPVTAGNAAAPVPKAENIHNFMYSGPTSWGFWWKGRRITAESVPDGFTILQIDANSVDFNDNGTPWHFEVGKMARQ